MATDQSAVNATSLYQLKANELADEILKVDLAYDDSYDLSQVDLTDRIQVRIDKNNAPKEMVERFTWQMSNSLFPPIVVTEDDVIVDGNTRAHAHRQREDRYVHALIVPVARHGADEETVQRLELFGQALNSVNGKSLDKNEQRSMVYHLIRLGRSNREIQVSAGVKNNVVAQIRNEVEGEDKLLRVGLPIDLVSGPALRALGVVADLNDQPFAELAQLTEDAGFNVGEIRGMAATIRETGSDELALERIKKERDANATRITERRSGTGGHPPAARQLRMRLGFINSRVPEAFVETNTEIMGDFLSELQQAVAVLSEAAVLQEKRVQEVAGA